MRQVIRSSSRNAPKAYVINMCTENSFLKKWISFNLRAYIWTRKLLQIGLILLPVSKLYVKRNRTCFQDSSVFCIPTHDTNQNSEQHCAYCVLLKRSRAYLLSFEICLANVLIYDIFYGYCYITSDSFLKLKLSLFYLLDVI